MSITTIESRVTYRSLMNKSKSDLADLVLMLMDMHGVEAVPLRILEQELRLWDGGKARSYALLQLSQEFPVELAGKRVRCTIELVGE